MKKKYIEQPENRKVIAMLQERQEVIDEVSNYNQKMADILYIIDEIVGKQTSKNPTYKSCAICDDRDEFDVKIGRKIAADKVDLKYHTAMTKKYNRYIGMLEDIIIVLEGLRNVHLQKRLLAEDDLQKYR
jgi:hypothetical protein